MPRTIAKRTNSLSMGNQKISEESVLKRNFSRNEVPHVSIRRAVLGLSKSANTKSKPVQVIRDKVKAFVDEDGNPKDFSSSIPKTKTETPSISELLQNPRYRIIKELKDSERTYLTFLQSIVLLFYSPCNTSLSTSNPILSSEEINNLFGNIHDVAELSSQILQAIEVISHPKSWDDTESSIGTLFSDLLKGDVPYVYSEYVSGYGKRLKLLSTTNFQFNQFRKEQEASQLCGNHTLSSLLITPIQRIPRYILLLRDLIRRTSKDHKDYNNLINAINEFEKLASSLDETKKRADTRDQYSNLISNLQKKSDSNLRTEIETKDIEAVGQIIEYKNGEFIPIICLLFCDMMIGCIVKKESIVSKIAWIIDLNSSHLSTSKMEISNDLKQKYEISNDYIILTELRLLDKEPYTTSETYTLFPSKAPYDMGFWYNSILTVTTSLWFDKKVLLRNSERFSKHIGYHLFPTNSWKLIQVGCIEESYKRDDIILAEGTINEYFYMIKQGYVKVVKPSNINITLARLTKNDFFGEFSFIQGNDTSLANASVIASIPTKIAKVSFSNLNNILLSNPEMMYRFFRFQCCIMANRLVLQLFTRLNTSEVRLKRHNSTVLRNELKKIASESLIFLEDTEDEVTQDIDPNEEEEFDLYIPHPEATAIFDYSKDILTKKYSSLLSKHSINPEEQILMELNTTIIKQEKQGRKGKLLILDNYIIFFKKTGFSNKVFILSFDDIKQVLQNENQYILVLVLDNENIQLIFDSCSSYFKAFSVIQNKKHLNVTNFQHSSNFTKDEWEYFTNFMEKRTIKQGEILIKLATTTETVYQVLKGKFLIKTTFGSGNEYPIVSKDAIFGDLTFLQGGISTADVIAETKSKVLCFHKSVIEDLTKTNPLLVGKFYRMLANEMISRFLAVQSSLLV